MNFPNKKIKAIGLKIREERKENNKMSQEDLCNKLNISRSSLSAWEQGKKLPDIDSLVNLCELFNCELGYILCDEGYEFKTRTQTDIHKVTGLSEDAIQNLINMREKLGTDTVNLISKLLESPHFWDMIEELETALNISVSTNTTILQEEHDNVIKCAEKHCTTDKEKNNLYKNPLFVHKDISMYGDIIELLSEYTPNKIILNKKDAQIFHLNEAQNKLRQAAEEIIKKHTKEV